MSLSATDNVPWGTIQWAATGLVTAILSSAAFVWRLARRIDGVETAMTTHRSLCDSNANASEAALIRLAEVLQQITEDHARMREVVSALPSRSELRDVEDRLIEQIAALANRLDRNLERMTGR